MKKLGEVWEEDDTYTGPRWRYGMVYRALGNGTPRGWILWSSREDPRFPIFGTVQYPRELTTAEIEAFQLVPLEHTAGQHTD